MDKNQPSKGGIQMTTLTLILLATIGGFLLGTFITLSVLYVCLTIKEKREDRKFKKLEREIENEVRWQF